MGASDWAWEKIEEMEKEFGVDNNRAVRITSLVRRMISSPEFKQLREVTIVDGPEFREIFTQNLIESLDNQDADTIEEKWNSLVRQHGFEQVSGVDVYIGPWEEGIEYRDLDNFDRNAVFENSCGETLTKHQVSNLAWEAGADINRVERGFLVGGDMYEFIGHTELTFEEDSDEKDDTEESNLGQYSLNDLVGEED
jgi:hypothetical protein